MRWLIPLLSHSSLSWALLFVHILELAFYCFTPSLNPTPNENDNLSHTHSYSLTFPNHHNILSLPQSTSPYSSTLFLNLSALGQLCFLVSRLPFARPPFFKCTVFFPAASCSTAISGCFPFAISDGCDVCELTRVWWLCVWKCDVTEDQKRIFACLVLSCFALIGLSLSGGDVQCEIGSRYSCVCLEIIA